MKKEEMIQKAIEIVTTGERNLSYGKPENNFQRIANLWNGYFSSRKEGEIQPHEVALLMILMKIARLINSPTHEDSIVDIVGYTACYADLVGDKND